VALAVGVMAGGVLQLALQWPFWSGWGEAEAELRLRPPGSGASAADAARRLRGRHLPVNIFIGTTSPPCSRRERLLSYYADRIVELPSGSSPSPWAPSLPSFSEQVALGKTEEFKRTSPFP
jgi:putative peptidoglycan lipid II flippase